MVSQDPYLFSVVLCFVGGNAPWIFVRCFLVRINCLSNYNYVLSVVEHHVTYLVYQTGIRAEE